MIKRFLLFCAILILSVSCAHAGLLASGSVTLANSRLSLVAGTAFVDFSTADVLTDYLGKKLIITDSAGKKASGYIKAAGTGETLGSELWTNGNMETGDPPTGWNTVLGSAVSRAADERTGGAGSYSLECTNTTGAGFGSESDYDIGNATGKLYKQSVWMKAISPDGVYLFVAWEGGLTGTLSNSTSWANVVNYYTSTTSLGERIYLYLNSNTVDSWVGRYYDYSIKQVLTPSATGVTIVSTKDGTVYNWTSEETGFNRNDADGYTYLITSGGHNSLLLLGVGR